MMKLKLDKLLKYVKRIAVRAVKSEIERIVTKANKPKDVTVEAAEDGVTVSGKGIKSRAVSDPEVRDIAR